MIEPFYYTLLILYFQQYIKKEVTNRIFAFRFVTSLVVKRELDIFSKTASALVLNVLKRLPLVLNICVRF